MDTIAHLQKRNYCLTKDTELINLGALAFQDILNMNDGDIEKLPYYETLNKYLEVPLAAPLLFKKIKDKKTLKKILQSPVIKNKDKNIAVYVSWYKTNEGFRGFILDLLASYTLLEFELFLELPNVKKFLKLSQIKIFVICY
jgi:hypothetical protein